MLDSKALGVCAACHTLREMLCRHTVSCCSNAFGCSHMWDWMFRRGRSITFLHIRQTPEKFFLVLLHHSQLSLLAPICILFLTQKPCTCIFCPQGPRRTWAWVVLGRRDPNSVQKWSVLLPKGGFSKNMCHSAPCQWHHGSACNVDVCLMGTELRPTQYKSYRPLNSFWC